MIGSTKKALKFVSISALTLLVLGGLFSSSAEAIVRGYMTSDEGLKPGMVVALSTSGGQVERAGGEESDRVVGVATNVDTSLVTIASGSAQIYVEGDGEVDAYVSDLNGEVKRGDLLAVSPLKGILAKAGSHPNNVIGIAVQDFNSAKTETYQLSGEDVKETKVATVRINLDRKAISNKLEDHVDSSLERLGKTIVGKDVGEVRVLIALLIFFIVLVAEGGILYGAISSAITSLGRNPLARQIIRHELLRVIIVAIFVLIFGLSAVYFVLWI